MGYMANKRKGNGNPTPNNTGKKYTRTAQDPRVAVFKAHYCNPNSDTFMNVLQSALRAGYSQEYSESLGFNKPQWYVDLMADSNVQRARMLKAAENSLETAVNYDDSDKERAALKLKASTFVAERLGKDLYSARQELTDKGGRRLFRSEMRQDANIALHSLFKGVKEQS